MSCIATLIIEWTEWKMEVNRLATQEREEVDGHC